jgi:raffinose/stachyose/melibiose transport system permease protein
MVQRKKANLSLHMLFLGPASMFFFISIILPFMLSIFYSFTDWNGVSNTISFVGIKNFIAIATGTSTFLKASAFTFTISIINIILVIFFGTAAALVLTSKLPLRSAFRMVFYMPNIMGGMVLGFIWRFIFQSGLPALGKILPFGFLETPWLASETGTFWGLVTIFTWQNVGYVMVVMTAGFMSLSKNVLEAAVIDGAEPPQVFFRVKLPLVMPYVTICLFWTSAMALKMFELSLALNKGGPYGSTTTLALSIFNDAFSNNKYGLATAESLVFFVIIVLVTSTQIRITQKKEAKYS